MTSMLLIWSKKYDEGGMKGKVIYIREELFK